MLAWVTASALVCIISIAIGFGSIMSVPPAAQSAALLIAALAALVMLGGFEAYETEAPRSDPSDD